MLRIRENQFEAFLPVNDRKITDFIINHLIKESQDLIDRIPYDSLKVMVTNGIARAKKYNLSSLADIAGFVSIMFEIAPNFDEIPEIQYALTDESIPQNKRFSQLFERRFDSAWELAADLNDDSARASAWFPELLTEEE